MVRTSKLDDLTDEEIALLEALHAFAKHPLLPQLREAVKEARERYFRNLAKGLAVQAGPVDQREIDEKRGFWKGALWAVYGLPKSNAKRFDDLVAEALKESESESGS